MNHTRTAQTLIRLLLWAGLLSPLLCACAASAPRAYPAETEREHPRHHATPHHVTPLDPANRPR